MSSFDKRIFFDREASDEVLKEQVQLFLDEGHTGTELIRLILHDSPKGISKHVSRLLTLFSNNLVSTPEGTFLT